jgi:hypothetical protein
MPVIPRALKTLFFIPLEKHWTAKISERRGVSVPRNK